MENPIAHDKRESLIAIDEREMHFAQRLGSGHGGLRPGSGNDNSVNGWVWSERFSFPGGPPEK